jgi:hypothetical protein
VIFQKKRSAAPELKYFGINGGMRSIICVLERMFGHLGAKDGRMSCCEKENETSINRCCCALKTWRVLIAACDCFQE